MLMFVFLLLGVVVILFFFDLGKVEGCCCVNEWGLLLFVDVVGLKDCCGLLKLEFYFLNDVDFL